VRKKILETLKIAMFSWESQHSVKVGGISPHVTELSETLVKKGHEVHIFTRIGFKSKYEIINGVHYHRVEHDQSGGIVVQMDRMCNAMTHRFEVVGRKGKFDVLHCHDWHPVMALNHLKKQKGYPYVMTFHSTEWGRNGNTFGTWWESREIAHREWLGGYEASQVIVTSQNLKNEVQFLYQIPDYKLNVIPNGITPGRVRRNLDPGRVKEKYGIHPLAPLILFIGRMQHQKGPDLLVEAIPHVLKHRWDAKFIFAGEGDLRAYCEHRAFELNVKHACRFTGYISDEECIELLNACDIVVVPSRNEPFGIVVLEAWDAGKPVIGTEAVGLIDNFRNGIKAYLSPESIAWCINHVIDNPEYLRRMGEEGRRDVERLYDWNTIADDTIDVYRHTYLEPIKL
jgi:glycosyltransferase involved in cell wall biosynthesis